jgi:hypothetical protein
MPPEEPSGEVDLPLEDPWRGGLPAPTEKPIEEVGIPPPKVMRRI